MPLKPTGTIQDLVQCLSIVRRAVITGERGVLLNFVTQSDLIKFLNEKKLLCASIFTPILLSSVLLTRPSGLVGSMSIEELGLGTTEVISVKNNQRVLEAFKLFAIKV